VNVNKSLTLIGNMQNDNPNLGGRTNPNDESIVDGTVFLRASDVTFNGFTVDGVGNGIFATSNGTTSPRDDKILDNIVDLGGVYLSGVVSANVSDNLITNAVDNSLFIDDGSSGVFVAGNTIQFPGKGYPAVWVLTDSANVTNDVLLTGNTIDGANTTGVNLDQVKNVTLTDNTINGGGLDLDQVKNVTVTGNLLLNNKIGIGLVESQANLISHNTIEGSLQIYGILVQDDTGDVIEYNTIKADLGQTVETVTSGIVLSSVTDTLVYGNNVEDNKTDGVLVASSSSVTVEDNVFSGNLGENIILSASTLCDVRHNSITGGDDGIYLEDDSDGNTIKLNNVSDVAQVGILLDATTQGNVVTDNVALGSGVFDAEDLSSGSSTARTNNTWVGNTFGTDNKGGGLSR
jgi:parallel beta-helix repeat protein